MIINFENLKKLEVKINKSCNNSKNYMAWMESTTRINYEQKWEKMMVELRGWDVVKSCNNTKKSWFDYCENKGLYPEYTFGDILA